MKLELEHRPWWGCKIVKNKDDIEFDGKEEGNGDGDDGGGDLRDNTLVKVKHMKKAAAYLS